MASPRGTQFERTVRIDQLGALYRQLGLALMEQGVPPVRAVEVLEQQVLIRCSDCAMPISGKEFAEAALSGKQPDDSKVGRLALGYCARRDCKSYYGDLSLQQTSNVDWSTVWRSVEQALNVVQTASPVSESSPSPVSLINGIFDEFGFRKIVATAVIVFAFSVLLWWLFVPPAYSRFSGEYGTATVFDPSQP